jgi:uncharacterized RDD family membrane protein YckC
MRRMIAVVVDIPIAVVCVVLPLIVILDPLLDAIDPPTDQGRAAFRLVALLWCALFVLVYSPLCVSRRGGTLGKRVMGLEVKRADGNGRLSYGKSVTRHVINLVIYTVTPLAIANASTMRLDERVRSMSDKAVGSVVVRR